MICRSFAKKTETHISGGSVVSFVRGFQMLEKITGKIKFVLMVVLALPLTMYAEVSYTSYGPNIRAAYSDTENCFFYGRMNLPWGTQVIDSEVLCYADGKLTGSQIQTVGGGMQGTSRDGSITWIIRPDRTFHVAIQQTIQKDDSF